MNVEDNSPHSPEEAAPKATLQLYAMLELQQQKHGLQYNNFQQYRQYLTRRLARQYALLNLKHGKRRYRHVELTAENCSTADHLVILVFLADRAWAMAESRRQDIVSNPSIRCRASHHVKGRLKKAVFWSEQLCAIAAQNADHFTQLECQAYHAEMSGRYYMQVGEYEKAKAHFQASCQNFRGLQESYSTETWSFVSLRVAKIEEAYRQCQIYLNEKPDASGVAMHAGKATLQWGAHRVLLSTHQIIELNKTIQELECKNEKIAENHARSSQGMHAFNKLIETYDKIIDHYTEIIETCSRNIQKGDGNTDDLQIEQNYFFFQRQRVKCDRMQAYINFHEEKVAQQGKRSKVQTSEADVMFLYENLADLAKESSVVPALCAAQAKWYVALSQWAKGCAMYYKGLSWCKMEQQTKAMACIRHAETLMRQSIASEETPKAARSLEKVHGQYIRMLIDENSRKAGTQPDQSADQQNLHEKRYCMVDGLNQRCDALAPPLPAFEPIMPKLAFYDCAYSFIDLPEMIFDEKTNQIAEKSAEAQAGWFGGWWS